ncbi:MAG: alpha/beta fold hydrolase [Desulfuromonadaceae bacterium]|nr:alpha/beta fold hydrolase [Desulfuromonadaceae bacterium]
MDAMINGTTLYYEDCGCPAGTPVVFVHGFPFSSVMWTDQLKAAGDRYRTIAYDLRGLGRSEVGDGQYTLEGHVDDLLALLDHLGVEQAIIVGFSMGGYITLRALERNPERFVAAALCDTRCEADDNGGKIKRANAAAMVKKEGAGAFADAFIPAVFSPAALAEAGAAVDLVREMIAATDPVAIAGNLIAMAARTDTCASLADIAMPILLIVGEEDAITPPQSALLMCERIKGSELQCIPAAGHMSNLENPQLFNRYLLSFLQRVTQG